MLSPGVLDFEKRTLGADRPPHSEAHGSGPFELFGSQVDCFLTYAKPPPDVQVDLSRADGADCYHKALGVIVSLAKAQTPLYGLHDSGRGSTAKDSTSSLQKAALKQLRE